MFDPSDPFCTDPFGRYHTAVFLSEMTQSRCSFLPTQAGRRGAREPTMEAMPRRLVLLGSLLAFTSLAFAIVPTAPAQAVGKCTASRRAWVGGQWIGVHLQRTTNCRYYAKFVMDHPSWGVGQKFTFKVERRVKSPYGWFISEKQSESTFWEQGERNTTSVDGWPSTSKDQDTHRACYRMNSAPWECTQWVSI
jgi:hypothetical protein